MTMTASARPIDGGLSHEIDVNGRHTIITDEPVGVGGGNLGPAPHELLPAMLAACASTMIATYAEPRELDVSDLRVDVEYDPTSTPRLLSVAVHAPSNFPEAQLERLRRIVDTCPVKRAFEAGFTFQERIVVGAPAVG
ncbi:MAG TPA: OsmC family protein [Solirubrobacteraceae bacterium]|nr:OsmC family protein [Solirubrobacteraceae bacterium]